MKWWPLWIGDLESATGDLLVNELGCYLRLLNHYYSSEKPIPGDERQVTRHLLTVCRTFADADVAAARSVLERYFTLEADGCWHNRKADEEIFRASKIIEKRAKAGRIGAASTNSKRGNGAKVGAASAATHAAASDAANAAANGSLSHTHTHSSKPKPKTIVGQTPPDPVDKSKDGTPKAIAVRTIEYLNQCAGTGFKAGEKGGASNEKFIVDRITIDGASEDELRAVIDLKVKHWQKGEFDRKYLRPETLFNKTKFAGYVGQIDLHAPTAAEPMGPRMARVAVWFKGAPRETYLSDTPAPAALNAEQIAKKVKSDFSNWLATRHMEYIRIEIPDAPAAQFSLAEL